MRPSMDITSLYIILLLSCIMLLSLYYTQCHILSLYCINTITFIQLYDHCTYSYKSSTPFPYGSHHPTDKTLRCVSTTIVYTLYKCIGAPDEKHNCTVLQKGNLGQFKTFKFLACPFKFTPSSKTFGCMY